MITRRFHAPSWVFVLLVVPAISSSQVPAGASARCRDGTYSFSQSRQGTCSHHGGVAEWLTTNPIQATPAGGTLKASEAKDHVGEVATVCGTVASAQYAAASRGQPTFLNLDVPYPNQLFTVVIWGSARGRFPEAPEVTYRGKRICVTGQIEAYRGATQIVVAEPTAIR